MILGLGQRGNTGFDRSVPATAIAGGEGRGVGKHYHVGEALPRRVGVSYSGGAMETVRPAVGMISGKGAPVAGGGRKVVEELHGEVAKLGVEAIKDLFGWRDRVGRNRSIPLFGLLGWWTS
jgi:hypothetical protein